MSRKLEQNWDSWKIKSKYATFSLKCRGFANIDVQRKSVQVSGWFKNRKSPWLHGIPERFLVGSSMSDETTVVCVVLSSNFRYWSSEMFRGLICELLSDLNVYCYTRNIIQRQRTNYVLPIWNLIYVMSRLLPNETVASDRQVIMLHLTRKCSHC